MLGSADSGKLELDAQEIETGYTALHHAAFGGCAELAVQLVRLGAAVGLPNRDGFTPLDTPLRSPDPTMSLSTMLLAHICKPSSWTPDRMVSASQSCKLPFNKADPKMARKQRPLRLLAVLQDAHEDPEVRIERGEQSSSASVCSHTPTVPPPPPPPLPRSERAL